ncbi:MAG TPA: TIGR03618 family F420-dependent PPOX class oxidoreductase [Chloroflexota bacterium]|jgi:PPOX class probable F420-dependent enzyme|nr:TIGR03618 family F420-dependent PPOX class oxidoreductase [Chloroflexota bacterium]
MALRIGPRLRAFLDEVYPAVIGTARRDGTVVMTPLWFEYADGQIWLNGGPNRAWLKRMQRTGRVSLLFLDPRNMFRYALVQGRLVGVTADGADAHIERLARRYTGGPYQGPKTDRLIVRIEPTKVTGGEMGQPWDVEESG